MTTFSDALGTSAVPRVSQPRAVSIADDRRGGVRSATAFINIVNPIYCDFCVLFSVLFRVLLFLCSVLCCSHSSNVNVTVFQFDVRPMFDFFFKFSYFLSLSSRIKENTNKILSLYNTKIIFSRPSTCAGAWLAVRPCRS